MKKVFAIILCLMLLYTGYYSFYKNDIDVQILKGEIQYSEELGWINLGHALPNETKEAYQELQELNQVAQDSFEFVYTQQMRFRVWDQQMTAQLSESRRIPPHLNEEEVKEVFLEIFVSVSESFEQMQGSFPYSLMPGCANSSFRNGDLTGDLISYFIAVSNISTEEFKEALTIFDAKSSLEKYEDEGMKEKTNWSLTENDRNKNNSIINELKELSEWIENDRKSLTSFLSQDDDMYFD